jgi:tetraacyldisaccharide 4'-kinase
MHFIIINGNDKIMFNNTFSMKLVPFLFVNLLTQKTVKPELLKEKYQNQTMFAVAGIGNPNRFFNQLRSLGLKNIITHVFPDHYSYKRNDFRYMNSIVLMTYKDAVKCQSFKKEEFWYLRVTPQIESSFFKKLSIKLSHIETKCSNSTNNSK